MGKPALMFFPDPAREMQTQNFTLDIGSRMPHFAEFWGIPGIEVCSREAELPAYCARLLASAGDPDVARRLQDHVRRFVDQDGPPFATKLNSLANRMMGLRSAELEMATQVSVAAVGKSVGL